MQRRTGFVGALSRRPASDAAAVGIARAVRIPVPSLRLSQLADLAADMLHGPVETRTLSRIAAASGVSCCSHSASPFTPISPTCRRNSTSWDMVKLTA